MVDMFHDRGWNGNSELLSLHKDGAYDVVSVFDWDTKEIIWKRVDPPVESEAEKKLREMRETIQKLSKEAEELEKEMQK